MSAVDFYLGSTVSPSVLQNFDGRVRSCSIIGRPKFRARDGRLVRGWFVDVLPPLPMMRGWPVDEPVGALSQAVLLVTDGQNLDAINRNVANVTVHSFEGVKRPQEAGTVLSFDELVDEWSFAEVTRDRSYLERYAEPFVTGHALLSSEEFAAYLRDLDPNEVRAAEEARGLLKGWSNLELSVLYYRIREHGHAVGDGPSV